MKTIITEIQGYPVTCMGMRERYRRERVCRECPAYNRQLFPAKPTWRVGMVEECILKKFDDESTNHT